MKITAQVIYPDGESKVEQIDLDKVSTQAPIRHKQLTEKQQKRIYRIFKSEMHKGIWGSQFTLEQMELNFMRDMNPDREIEVWERMVQCFDDYIADHPNEVIDRKQLAREILFIRMGVTE